MPNSANEQANATLKTGLHLLAGLEFDLNFCKSNLVLLSLALL